LKSLSIKRASGTRVTWESSRSWVGYLQPCDCLRADWLKDKTIVTAVLIKEPAFAPRNARACVKTSFTQEEGLEAGHLEEMCSGSEAGSYLRLIDFHLGVLAVLSREVELSGQLPHLRLVQFPHREQCVPRV